MVSAPYAPIYAALATVQPTAQQSVRAYGFAAAQRGVGSTNAPSRSVISCVRLCVKVVPFFCPALGAHAIRIAVWIIVQSVEFNETTYAMTRTANKSIHATSFQAEHDARRSV